MPPLHPMLPPSHSTESSGESTTFLFVAIEKRSESTSFAENAQHEPQCA